MAAIDAEAAVRVALSYYRQRCAAPPSKWPSALVVGKAKREGDSYIVCLMPENEMGLVNFFVTYRVWVNAHTGIVERMR